MRITVLAALAVTLLSGLVFLVSEGLGYERVATGAAWALAVPTALFAVPVAACVVGYALAAVVTALAYLTRALRR